MLWVLIRIASTTKRNDKLLQSAYPDTLENNAIKMDVRGDFFTIPLQDLSTQHHHNRRDMQNNSHILDGYLKRPTAILVDALIIRLYVGQTILNILPQNYNASLKLRSTLG